MLEVVYIDPATPRWLRSCALDVHAESFCARFPEFGYDQTSVRIKLSILGKFARWMQRRHLAVRDLDERRAQQFVRSHRREGWGYRGAEYTVVQFVAFLQCAGVLDARLPVRDDSPARRAPRALRGVPARGARARAMHGRGVPIRRAAVRRGDAAASAATLHAKQVREFLLARTRNVAPRRAQAVAIALRSLLRFLFLRGETPVDLSRAVPTVRRARLASVPRQLAPHEVERVLSACDLASPTGRRDHAVLLLVARLGLRASEVLALEQGDLRWREGEIRLRGKGLLRDRLPLPAASSAATSTAASYTERYLRTPQENEAGYDASSVIKAAEDLHGHLVLIHGTMDDDVHLQNTIQLLWELEKANKQNFELMLYPRSTHGLSGEASTHEKEYEWRALRRLLDPA